MFRSLAKKPHRFRCSWPAVAGSVDDGSPLHSSKRYPDLALLHDASQCPGTNVLGWLLPNMLQECQCLVHVTEAYHLNHGLQPQRQCMLDVWVRCATPDYHQGPAEARVHALRSWQSVQERYRLHDRTVHEMSMHGRLCVLLRCAKDAPQVKQSSLFEHQARKSTIGAGRYGRDEIEYLRLQQAKRNHVVG